MGVGPQAGDGSDCAEAVDTDFKPGIVDTAGQCVGGGKCKDGMPGGEGMIIGGAVEEIEIAIPDTGAGACAADDGFTDGLDESCSGGRSDKQYAGFANFLILGEYAEAVHGGGEAIIILRFTKIKGQIANDFGDVIVLIGKNRVDLFIQEEQTVSTHGDAASEEPVFLLPPGRAKISVQDAVYSVTAVYFEEVDAPGREFYCRLNLAIAHQSTTDQCQEE